MIYPYTAVLHGIMALLCFLSFAYLFYKKQSGIHSTINLYFNWFLFFFLYNVTLFLPLLIFHELSRIFSYFYILALLFLSLGAWQAFDASLHFWRKNGFWHNLISKFFLVSSLFAVVMHLIFPQIPLGSPDGKWIFWYPGNYISLLFIFFMFLAGWVFALSFVRGFSALPSTLLQLRAISFFLGAFILPFAAFFYFGAVGVRDIYLAFSFSILGLLCFVVGNILIGFFKNPAS